MMTVVKADGYGHGLVESARAARDAGAEWLGVATLDEALALRAAGDEGRVLCWLTVPGRGLRRTRSRPTSTSPRTRSRDLDEIAAAVGRAAHRPASSSRSTPACPAAARRWPCGATWSSRARSGEDDGQLDGHRHLVALLLQRRARRPGERRPGEAVRRGARRRRPPPGWTPRSGTWPTPRPRSCGPSARLDLVRCGIASYGLDPAPGVTPPLGLVPGDDRPRRPGDGQAGRGRGGRLLRPHLDRRRARPGSAWSRSGTPTGCRGSAATGPRSGSAAGGARSAAGSAWTSSSSTSTATTPAPAPTS